VSRSGRGFFGHIVSSAGGFDRSVEALERALLGNRGEIRAAAAPLRRLPK
jgi:hypothetical protein